MRSILDLPYTLLAVLAVARPSFSSSICSNNPSDLVPDGCTSFRSLEQLHTALQPLVADLTQHTDYFRYYRLNLYGRDCPFWSSDGMCGNRACAVSTIDDEAAIPPIWRAAALGRLEGPKAPHPPPAGALGAGTAEACVVERDDADCDERDYCVPEDDAGAVGDYVSLTENPERFTGYAGGGARNVWQYVYRETCFSRPAAPATAAVLSPLAAGPAAAAALELDDGCIEKRTFYRVVSGMHASINLHLCWDHLNQSSGAWAPSLDCFVGRFGDGSGRERLQNVYFNYAVLLRAVAKLRALLPAYTFCAGDAAQDRLTRDRLRRLAQGIPADVFDESAMFRGDEMAALKVDFRNRFRNVSRIMDCVGCDKCRLWGKLQTQGYGTALKVLFEFDETPGAANPPLRRTELVALINTLGRVTHSLEAIQGFQTLWEERNRTLSGQARPEAGHAPADMLTMILQQCYELPSQVYNATSQKIIGLWEAYVGREGASGSTIRSEL